MLNKKTFDNKNLFFFFQHYFLLDNMASNHTSMEVNAEEIPEKGVGMEIEVGESRFNKDTYKFLTHLQIDKNEILFAAIENESPRIVEDLLKIGCDPNATDLNVDFERTPLSKALERNRIDIAEILLQNGADINATCCFRGQTVLHHAASYRKLEIVKFLLQHNANINALDYERTTPLYLATIHDDNEIVKTLLINGANANIQDNNELITPFFCAIEDIVKVYFDFAINLDFNKRDLEGDTPFEYMLKDNELETFNIMKMIAYHQHS